MTSASPVILRVRSRNAILPWLTNALLCMLGCGLLYLSHRFVSEHEIHTALRFSGIAIWSASLYVAAVFVVLTSPANRWTFPIILLFAVLCRLGPLSADPFLSTDIYRYVWDGIVQHAHINPYRFAPGDPALSFLRAPHQEIYDHINRREYAHTIYPPFGQMIYYAATAIAPTVFAMKLWMFACELITITTLSFLLIKIGRSKEQALLYAWCPLLLWEISGAGHIDGAIIALIALALLFRAQGRFALTGLFLGFAVMTKFYPIVLFPALYRRGDWKMPATLAAVAAIGYAIYSSVGLMVFGFLSGYTAEEGITTGERYFLLQWIQSLPGMQWFTTSMYTALCALVFLGLTLWIWKQSDSLLALPGHTQSSPIRTEPLFLNSAALLAFSLMLLFSPHYPWYVVWLIPFFALAPSLPMLTYLMGFFYLFTTSLAIPGPKMYLLNEILYGSVLAAGLVHLAYTLWNSRRTGRKIPPARAA